MNFIYSYIKLYNSMDQKLLQALDNLSLSLEAIASALSSSSNDNNLPYVSSYLLTHIFSF